MILKGKLCIETFYTYLKMSWYMVFTTSQILESKFFDVELAESIMIQTDELCLDYNIIRF